MADDQEFDGDSSNVSHLARHTILREEAEQSILDEERVKAVRRTKAGRIVVVVFTFRVESIRPITAYDAPLTGGTGTRGSTAGWMIGFEADRKVATSHGSTKSNDEMHLKSTAAVSRLVLMALAALAFSASFHHRMDANLSQRSLPATASQFHAQWR